MKKLIGLMLLAWCGVATAQVNGGAVSFADPGGGQSFFLNGVSNSGTFTNLPAMAKGFFTALGWQACGGAGTGMTAAAANSENTCVGWAAGSSIQSGTYNTVVGVGSFRFDTTGTNNTIVGTDSLSVASGQSNNVAVGNNALHYGGNQNVAVGVGALQGTNADSLQQNVALGYSTLSSATTASSNVAVGFQAMTAGTSNSQSTTVGYNSQPLSTGSYNTSLGSQTLSNETTGQFMTAIGLGSGGVCATGLNNLLIGSGQTAVTCPAAASANLVNISNLVYYNTNSTATPAVSACGTSPGIDTHANNKSGTVTVGSGTVTSCTITFAGSGYSTWNHCRVTYQSAVVSPTYSYTTTVLTLGGTSLTSVRVDYDCDGY